MSAFDSLLIPVSEEKPCGEDVSWNPEFLELDSLIRGKAETQFSEAEEPDWKLIHRTCLKLFALSKHLQLATVLCLSSLQTEGIPAAADALEFLSGLLEKYWDSMYPSLDPTDNNDPLERLNILSSLSCAVGTFGDSFRFVERLSKAPLTNSPRLGKLSFTEVNSPRVPDSPTDAAAQAAQIEAAFRDTPPADLEAMAVAIRRAIAATRSITAFLDHLHGVQNAPSFEILLRRLMEIERTLTPYLPEDAVVAVNAEIADGEPVAERSVSGGIESRNDVVAALDRICAFYARSEPASPVPLLLQRAKRLVHSDFLKIMADLAPDSVAQIQALAGIKESAS